MNILIDMVCHGHGQAGYILDEIFHTINEGHFSGSKFFKYGNAQRILGSAGASLFELLTRGNPRIGSNIRISPSSRTPPSASYNYRARKAADNVTRILRGKNLRGGFFQLHIVDEVSHRGFLSFMAEFLRHKRNEYGLIGFFVGDKLHEIWVTMGSRINFSFHPDGVIERATEIGCTQIIFGHNHPAPLGTLVPSQEDYQVKRSLKSRLKPVSIGLESYVFTRGHYISY